MLQHVCTVGITLAQPLFHLVGLDLTGKRVWRKRLRRHARGPLRAQWPLGTSGLAA